MKKLKLLKKISKKQTQAKDRFSLQPLFDSLQLQYSQDYLAQMKFVSVVLNVAAAIDRLLLKQIQPNYEALIDELYLDKQQVATRQQCEQSVQEFYPILKDLLKPDELGVYHLTEELLQAGRGFNEYLYSEERDSFDQKMSVKTH